VPENYALLGQANPNQQIDFIIGLKQRNLDALEASLLDISNPESPNYARWWTSQQILDLIAPLPEQVQPVIDWLSAHGVEQIDASGRDLIKVSAPVRLAEQLFNTKIYYYRYTINGRIVPRALGAVNIPDHLTVIDGIFGLTELIQPSSVKSRRSNRDNVDPLGYIYPGLLRQLYNIPESYKSNPKSSICVAEFLDSASFNKDDISAFNYWMSENVHVDKIVGDYDGSNPFFESSLDVQYGSSLALNTTFWFWTVKGWMFEFATELFNATQAPYIVSMSWGWPEDDQCKIIGCKNSWHPVEDSYDYVRKVNVEFMKVGLRGITLLASSGDQGAPGDENSDCPGYLSSIFPGASPWVTTVGATMLVKSSEQQSDRAALPPLCQKVHCAAKLSEAVCSYPTAMITSGGGFSDILPMPLYQQAAVSSYLDSGVVDLPSSYYFNASNRAFPDVAANGHNFVVEIGGGLYPLDGTSCSTPVFAAVLALLNSNRLDNNKNPLGFVNPLLYKMAAADSTTFTDITVGNNYCTEVCCGEIGYQAAPGWDAATGLGTPNFPRMLNYVKSLKN
jgi:tripeptidyl-peptidase-1